MFGILIEAASPQAAAAHPGRQPVLRLLQYGDRQSNSELNNTYKSTSNQPLMFVSVIRFE